MRHYCWCAGGGALTFICAQLGIPGIPPPVLSCHLVCYWAGGRLKSGGRSFFAAAACAFELCPAVLLLFTLRSSSVCCSCVVVPIHQASGTVVSCFRCLLLPTVHRVHAFSTFLFYFCTEFDIYSTCWY